MAWPDARLLLEVDGGLWVGGRHNQPGRWGIDNDAEKQSTAAAQGWRTMRITNSLIDSGRAVELIEAALGYGDGPPAP
jgi:very-short-patch-repair endonuclease